MVPLVGGCNFLFPCSSTHNSTGSNSKTMDIITAENTKLQRQNTELQRQNNKLKHVGTALERENEQLKKQPTE